MSTMTEPGFILPTASAVTRTGGLRPGTWAVVITTSMPPMTSLSSACWAARSSAVSSRAYPPAPVASMVVLSLTNFAPRLSACSRVSGRTSYACTTAPSRFAVPMAWSPATPIPRISTLAGLAVPAAVVSSGK